MPRAVDRPRASPPACRRSRARRPAGRSRPSRRGRPRCTGCRSLYCCSSSHVEDLLLRVERFQVAGRGQGVHATASSPTSRGSCRSASCRRAAPSSPGTARPRRSLAARGRIAATADRGERHHHEARQRRGFEVAAAGRLDAAENPQRSPAASAGARRCAIGFHGPRWWCTHWPMAMSAGSA